MDPTRDPPADPEQAITLEPRLWLATLNGSLIFSLFPFANNPGGVYGANTYTQVLPANARGVVASANTGADNQTIAHMRNWMKCIRDRNQKTNADIHAAYNHSVALCMTIAAIQTGKKVTFDDKLRKVVTA